MECPAPGARPDFGIPGLGPHETTALLRGIFTSLGEAVLVVDPASRCIVSCNPAVEEIFGYRPEELLGQETAVLHLSPESFGRFGALSEAALDQSRTYRGGYRMRHRDGREIVTEHTVTPIFPELGWRAGVVSVVRDVTDSKRAEEFRDRHGLACRVSDDGSPKPLGPEIRDVLYRAVRELLFNVTRHARARSATVSLRRTGEDIEIEVADDGVGFAAGDADRRRGKDTGYGLFSIGERLAYLGGECRVASEPGEGTRVTLVAPLAGAV